MNKPTSTYLLMEIRLGVSLSEYISAQRERGRSWDRLVADLNEKTGILVTSQTLRNWFPEHTRVSA